MDYHHCHPQTGLNLSIGMFCLSLLQPISAWDAKKQGIDECILCFEPFVDDLNHFQFPFKHFAARLMCDKKHVFGYSCIVKWTYDYQGRLGNTDRQCFGSCPSCRAEILPTFTESTIFRKPSFAEWREWVQDLENLHEPMPGYSDAVSFPVIMAHLTLMKDYFEMPLGAKGFIEQTFKVNTEVVREALERFRREHFIIPSGWSHGLFGMQVKTLKQVWNGIVDAVLKHTQKLEGHLGSAAAPGFRVRLHEIAWQKVKKVMGPDVEKSRGMELIARQLGDFVVNAMVSAYRKKVATQDLHGLQTQIEYAYSYAESMINDRAETKAKLIAQFKAKPEDVKPEAVVLAEKQARAQKEHEAAIQKAKRREAHFDGLKRSPSPRGRAWTRAEEEQERSMSTSTERRMNWNAQALGLEEARL